MRTCCSVTHLQLRYAFSHEEVLTVQEHPVMTVSVGFDVMPRLHAQRRDDSRRGRRRKQEIGYQRKVTQSL